MPVARRSAADKAAAEQRMKAENAAHKARLIEAGAQGRDVKSLSDETEAARIAVAERVAMEKKLVAAKMAEENAQMREKLANTTGRDEKGLSAETEAMRAAVEERRQMEKQLQAAKLMVRNE